MNPPSPIGLASCFAALSLLGLAACHAESPSADADSLTTIATYAVAEGEAEVACADFNRDGYRDVVISSSPAGKVYLLLGDGSGLLRPGISVDAGANPTDLATADFDGDGLWDLVVANHETHQLTLLLGDVDVGFRPSPQSPLQVDVAPHPHSVRMADMDADGRLDIVVDHREAGAVVIYRGLGNGAFQSTGQRVDVGGDPYLGMAVSDLNHDGRPDLVTPGPRSVEVTLSTAATGLGFSRGESVAAADPFAVTLADMNGDGTLDVIAAAESAEQPVTIHAGVGQGRFADSPFLTLAMAAGGKKIITGDFDGDGTADAVVGSWNSDLRVVWGGRLTSQRLDIEGAPWGLLACDLNEDGSDELLVADGSSNRLVVLTLQRQSKPADR